MAAVIFAVGVFHFRELGIDYLLPFGILLAGTALVCQMVIVWGMGETAGRHALLGGVSGAAIVGYAAFLLSAYPDRPEPVAKVLLIVLMGLTIVAWRRVASRNPQE